MTTQPEARITAAILKALHSLPRCWCFKVHGGAFQSAGIPDIIGVLDGRLFAIEVKTATGRATRLQELTIARITAAGGAAGVARSVDEALSILETHESGTR